METSPKDVLLCQSTSPMSAFPCTKPDHHNRTEQVVTHQHGSVTWRDANSEYYADSESVPLAAQIHRAASRMMRDLGDLTGSGDTPINLGKPTSVTFTPAGGDPIDLTDMVSNVTYGEGEMDTGEAELREWWMNLAEDEADRVIPKAVEYSATDLADIGHVLARGMRRKVSDQEAAELGVFFYLQGKLSRWAGAVTAGRRPSDDTLHDIGVYVRMAQRIRHAGNWPGVKLDSPE